jgi:predicted RNA methylase
LNSEHDKSDFSVIDIGAGSGYFIKALTNFGFKDVRGYEVSEGQVRLANMMLEDDRVEQVEINNLVDVISETNSKVVSMIGVLDI